MPEKQTKSTKPDVRHHLVILHEPYLKLMLAGRKRIECRFSSQLKAPCGAVRPGDLLWLKPPCRPVIAVARAGRCEYWPITGQRELKKRIEPYKDDICAEAGFWKDLAWVRYVSLIWVQNVLSIEPIPVSKADRRGWVVMSGPPRPHAAIG